VKGEEKIKNRRTKELGIFILGFFHSSPFTLHFESKE